jgi:hypothetical protein
LQSRTNSESSDWQTVRRSSAVLPPNNINGVARNIELENMFGFLNHSQHEEETVPRVPSSIPMTKKKFVLNGNHITNDSSATTSRSVTPISDCSPFKTSGVVVVVAGKSSKKIGKVKKIRSKSTSPARKIESSVSKKMFKHFNPDRVDWIQNKKT